MLHVRHVFKLIRSEFFRCNKRLVSESEISKLFSDQNILIYQCHDNLNCWYLYHLNRNILLSIFLIN